MADLATWLLARIAEDEVAIKARDLDRPIHFVGCYYYDNTLDAGLYCDCDEHGEASRKFLAECAAKRRIVERLLEIARAEPDDIYGMGSLALTDVLRLLALPYADAPGYDQSWSVQ